MKPYFIDDNEKILWQGKPHKFMYLLNGASILSLIFLLVWVLMFSFIGSKSLSFSNEYIISINL